MTKFFVDLYSMVYEYYRIRQPVIARTNAEGVCLATSFFCFLNIVQLVELLTGVKRLLPNFNRRELWIIAIPTYLLLSLCMMWFIRRHSALRTPEDIHAHSLGISRGRKITLLAFVIGNFVTMVLVAQFRSR
jgi:ABC-type Fe3+-siderophore transport system permease subunit